MTFLRTRLLPVAFLGTVLSLAACGREDASEIAGPLITEGSVRTYELVLDPARFLVEDTTLSGYVRQNSVTYMILARGFQGTLDSNALARFVSPPSTITVLNSAGLAVTDTAPRFFAGSVLLRVDTVRTRATAPITFELYRTAEEFDASTATWTNRVDSVTVKRPWAQPGGTRGPLVSRATWTPGTDSVVFAVDSATLVAWADTLNKTRGALIVSTTDNSRLRASSIAYRVSARSSLRDTTVVVTTGNLGSTFIFNPGPAPAGNLRVGGLPSWRSYLRFRSDLDTISVPCPGSSSPGCTVRLKNATVNYAALLLYPIMTPPPFALEDSLIIDAFTVVASNELPLARLPLGGRVGRTVRAAQPTMFTGAATQRFEVPITNFVSQLASGPPSDSVTTALRTNTIALVGAPEGGLFGLASFAPLKSEAPPLLRIVVTVAAEVQLP